MTELSLQRDTRIVNLLRFHHWPVQALFALLIFTSAGCKRPAETGSVRGSVHLADTKLPAEGTNVSLIRPAGQEFPKIDKQTGEYIIDDNFGVNYSAKVDASGSFQIGGVRPGDYFVLTIRSGYLSQREYIYPGALSPELNPGQSLPAFVQKVHVASSKTQQVNMLLERGGAIAGTISFSGIQTRPSGLANIAVVVEIKTKDGRLMFTSMGAVDTDKAGHYRIDGLPPANYAVIADGSIYCCNSIRGSKARVFEVHGTETLNGVDIEIPPVGLHRVTGTAVTETGEPVRRGIVRLYPTGEQMGHRATELQGDGTFSFDHVADEDYTVSLEAEIETELVGPTANRGGFIMRMKKPAFLPVHQDIHVSGKNPPAVILRVQSLPN